MFNIYIWAQIKYNVTIVFNTIKEEFKKPKVKSRHMLYPSILTQQSCPNENHKENNMPPTEKSSQFLANTENTVRAF